MGTLREFSTLQDNVSTTLKSSTQDAVTPLHRMEVAEKLLTGPRNFPKLLRSSPL